MKRGFTLLELLIVIGILAILAGAMVPMFRFSRAQARENKARTDVEAIRTAAMMYNSDTGLWPLVGNTGAATCLITNSAATCPTAAAGWNGPYLAEWGNDPFTNTTNPNGMAYAIFDATAATNSVRWVQSFGPDNASDNCVTTCAVVPCDDICAQITAADGTGSG